MIKKIQLFGLLYLFSTVSLAGTVVDIQNDSELTRAVTDGQKVRMNLSASEYVVLDNSDHSVKIVNPQKQLVTFVNVAELVADGKSAVVRPSIAAQGQGQIVAGYDTQKYSYSANGQHGGVLYGSQNAYQVNGVKQLLAAMRVMMEKQRAALGGFASLVDACTLADMQLIEFVDTVGLPMRTEKNGRVELEVKAIETDVALADDVFLIPASYKAVDLSGSVIPATKNIAAAQKHGQQQNYQYRQPQAPSRMRQMQQPERMYPHTMQPAYRMPRMIRQY